MKNNIKTSSNKLTNAEFAYLQSQGFYDTGMSLLNHLDNNKSENGYIWIAPAVVNFSLATELIIKALLIKQTKKVKWGHGFYELYKEFSPSTKERIQEVYLDKLSSMKDRLPTHKITLSKNIKEEKTIKDENILETIKELLAIHDKSFLNWRYLFEFGQGGYNYSFHFHEMNCFYLTLQELILETIKRPTMNIRKVDVKK